MDTPDEESAGRSIYRRLPSWACRLIAAAVPVVVAGLAAGALTVATGFGVRPDAFEKLFPTAGWIGLAAACLGAAAVVLALYRGPRKRWVEATGWAFAAVPLFGAAYIAIAAVAALAGHVYHRGFD